MFPFGRWGRGVDLRANAMSPRSANIAVRRRRRRRCWAVYIVVQTSGSSDCTCGTTAVPLTIRVFFLFFFLKKLVTNLRLFPPLLFPHSHDFNTRLKKQQQPTTQTTTVRASSRNYSTRWVERKKSANTVLSRFLFYFIFILCSVSFGENVQEEGGERKSSELQEPQGVAEERQKSGRRRRSILWAGLPEQTVPQQQRGVLRHRLQGESASCLSWSCRDSGGDRTCS